VSMLAGHLGITVTVTDGDGDHAVSNVVDVSTKITFDDDGPTVVAKTNLVFSNSTSSGTGIYQYSIGADGNTFADATHSDFAPITLTGSVGATNISNTTVVWSSETASTGTFLVGFDYLSGGATVHETGTLTFDKVAGTYSVTLDAPIQSITIVTTSGQNTVFHGYDANSNTPDNAGPAAVSVAQLTPNFFVQFTGYHETGGGGGVSLSAGLTNPGNTSYVNGEQFFAAATDVTVNTSQLGVASNTIQGGEVLNLHFATSDTHGVTPTNAQTAGADGIFLIFDNVGATEDLVINVDLRAAGLDGVFGTVDDTFLTKAIVVANTDIYKTNDPALAALGISLGNKQGAVVIESNDYNAGGEHYQLVGAQVLTSTEGISGTGIDLNSATGAGGASTGTEAFGAITTDTDVFKIVTAGFITTNTTTQDANLQFDVTNVDGDGDKTASQTLNVTVEGSTTFVGTTSADVIYGATGNDSLTGNGGNDIFVLQASGGGIDTIADLNVSGIDEIVVNIASQTLSISNAALIDAATQFNSGSGAPTSGGPAWAENPGGGDKFYYDTTNHNVWYSAGGTGADQVQLAHLSTGVPAADVAAAIHVA
jgi:hypothetical protein